MEKEISAMCAFAANYECLKYLKEQERILLGTQKTIPKGSL